ncbi:hypothetical protein [Actinomadura violacea]|uniref:Uncharacterized protein n=1 Tax=Actinomadura violacea TaxID=2819934 RepID=A0ABS3RSK4_9ACTN|nr:hypothetical protein [Actinomadura violacea]MBO2459703.1 hypothetical protein [Actinomadura violacea]
MSAVHRPLSEWVTEVALQRDGTGTWDPQAEPNSGDRARDARRDPRFEEGWERRRIVLESASGERHGVLGLVRAEPGPDGVEAAAELTHAGAPVLVSEAGIAVVERLERQWPQVRQDPADLAVLAAEPVVLRWSLVGRLVEEGDPGPEMFHILPWELVERSSRGLIGAIDAGRGASGVLLMHWFAPTGSWFGGAMDQMSLWLRDAGAAGLAEHGGIALCEELADADLGRFPEPARRALAELTRRLAGLDAGVRGVAQQATARLSGTPTAPTAPAAPTAPGTPTAPGAPGAADSEGAQGPSAPPDAGVSAEMVEAVTNWLRDLPVIGPGERSADVGGGPMRLAVTEQEDGGEVVLEVPPSAGDVPVIVRAEADGGAVTYLKWLTGGRMRLEVDSPPPYEVGPAPRRPRSGRASAGGHTVVPWPGREGELAEGVRSEPLTLQRALADYTPDEPRDERILVVPHLDLKVTVYESGDGRLIVSASVSSREADGRWLELVLHEAGGGSSRECVIPLRWAYDAAEGALIVGGWQDSLSVSVGPELVGDPALLSPEAVRWSAEHAKDERTGEALRSLLRGPADPGGTP